MFVLANIYNHQHVHYNRKVLALYEDYAAKIATQRTRERLYKEQEEAELRRTTLERRHVKALRTMEGAQWQLTQANARRWEWE